MSRFPTIQQQPPPPTFEGDASLVGVDMKSPRDQVASGMASYAENKRFINGAATRRGTRTPLFANAFSEASIFGSGVYSDPNGYEMGLLCGASHVIGFRAGTYPVTIPIAAGELPITGRVEFSQQFDKVLLHRDDPGKSTLIWDGADLTTGFIPIASTVPAGSGIGIVVIPNSPWSINFRGRLWAPVPGARDSFFASDINDYTTYDRDLHTFRVNAGTSDELVGVFPYSSNNLIVGKRRSIDLLQSIPGDLGDAFIDAITLGLAPSSEQPPQVSVVSESIGMIGRKAGIIAGNTFLFLSDSGEGGIYQITQGGGASGSALGVDPNPISDPIEPLIRRINWNAASGAVAKQSGIFVHFAVPLDGATFNNAVLTFNLSTGHWQGMDTWRPLLPSGDPDPNVGNSPMRADNLLVLDYFNTSRLFAANHDGKKVHLLFEGMDDQLAVSSTFNPEPLTIAIIDVVETRGYNTLGWNAASYRDFLRLEMALLINNAFVNLSEIIDGQNDIRSLGLISGDLTSYDIWGKPRFVLTNENNDFDAPKRGDYWVSVNAAIQLQDGIPLRRLAPKSVRFATTARGRFVYYRLENRSGYCSLLSVTQESSAARPEMTLA